MKAQHIANGVILSGIGSLRGYHVHQVANRDFPTVNIFTNKVVRILGKDDPNRWINISLYQGAPAKKGFTTAVRS